MDRERIDILIAKVFEGTVTEAELQELDKLYLEYEQQAGFIQELNTLERETYKQTLFAKITARVRIPEQKPAKQVKVFGLKKAIAIAAALAAIVFGIWFFNTSRPSGPSRHLERSEATRDLLNYANDIAPGKHTAVLTLANGKVIKLSDAKQGVLIGKDLKYDDGSFVQDSSGAPLLSATQVVTASTPRGGTYQITLPDGSKVWLNAASSLKFSSGLGKLAVRSVELSGEAYFEITKNKKQAFIVKSKGQEVKVLGTHFNISSYADENIVKTTLLEGSVRVNNVILKPNQQSVLTNNQIKILPANTEETIAWKNGYFRFNNEKIESLMARIARWYDVELVYEGKTSKEGFTGTISRNKNISEILNTLELTGFVKFKIEGRRVIIMQ